MLANGASLTLCRFSDEPFNTNEIIFPRWTEIPSHPPTAAFRRGCAYRDRRRGVGRLAQAEREATEGRDRCLGFARRFARAHSPEALARILAAKHAGGLVRQRVAKGDHRAGRLTV